MFPLFGETIFHLIALGIGLGIAVWLARAGRPRGWVIVLVLALAVLWPWALAAWLGLDGYTMQVAIMLMGWTLGSVVAGGLWGLAARALPGRTMVLALLPAVLAAGWLLERQRVPDAACAQSVTFAVGDLLLSVPREMGARTVVAEGAPPQVWEGSYSDFPGAKPQVKRLCGVTRGTSGPVEVSHLWVAFHDFRDAGAPGAQDAYARTRLTVGQFYARPDGLPRPSLSHFSGAAVEAALAEGRRAGLRCNETRANPQERFCDIWFDATPEVFAVVSARIGPEVAGEDPVGDARALVAAFRSWLAP